mgnify:FL=1
MHPPSTIRGEAKGDSPTLGKRKREVTEETSLTSSLDPNDSPTKETKITEENEERENDRPIKKLKITEENEEKESAQILSKIRAGIEQNLSINFKKLVSKVEDLDELAIFVEMAINKDNMDAFKCCLDQLVVVMAENDCFDVEGLIEWAINKKRVEMLEILLNHHYDDQGDATDIENRILESIIKKNNLELLKWAVEVQNWSLDKELLEDATSQELIDYINQHL